jgi:type I restriction enzyme, S subunit
VAWVGSIPSHWDVAPVKYLGSVTLGKMIQSEVKAPEDVSADYMRAANVQPDGILATDDVKEMFFTSHELSQLTLRAGDVVVVEGGVGGFGRSAYLQEDLGGWGFQNSINRLRLHDGVDGRFVNYLLLTARRLGFIHAYCTGVSMPHFTAEKLAGLQVPLAPPDEQRAIADYLDHETARIDALIGRQERLIDVLGERRSAMITHSVTRGLDPGAPLKDSGVVWLGEVPAAWTVLGLGRVIDTLAGFSFGSANFSSDPDDVRLLRGANVSPGSMNWADVVYWPKIETEGLDAYWLEAGDLVLGLDRPIISTGIRVACIEHDDLPALLLQRVCRIRATHRADQRYLAYVLGSVPFRYYLEPIFTGVSVPHMSEGQLRDFRVALPALDDQLRIVAHLDRETAKIDALVDKAQAMNVVLRERRAALISAAVTGKIDVTLRSEGAPDGAI